jgi:hypothetical protein
VRAAFARRTHIADFGEDSETNALPFCIEIEITSEERRRDKLRTTQETQYSQSR